MVMSPNFNDVIKKNVVNGDVSSSDMSAMVTNNSLYSPLTTSSNVKTTHFNFGIQVESAVNVKNYENDKETEL